MRASVARLRMDLLGLAAPKKSMSLNATMELDQENEVLQAELAEAYGAALAERDREIADLRARLGDAGNGGPPAVTVLLAGQTDNELHLRSADVSRAWYADLWFDLLEWAVPW